MRDTLTSLNRGDFTQRYRGGFGWLLRENGTKVLVHITEVDQNKVLFDTSKESGFFAFTDKGVEFEFLPITRGHIPTEDGIYLCQRHPARQFQRGISEGNTQLFKFNNRGSFSTCAVSLEHLSAIFERPIPYEESVKKYLDNKKQMACALSLHFAINGDNFFFMTRQAGKVVNRTTLTVPDLIRQEVQDLINRNTWLSSFTLETEKV